jgi:SAM-dependent methyltransferase
MTETHVEKVVGVFNKDASEGGYVYTRPEKLSARFSNARMSAAISAAVPWAGRRVLDLGCGDGTYTRDLITRDKASFVKGIDPAPDAIAHARALAAQAELSNCVFQQSLIGDVDATEHFDVAVLRGVLHHLDDPAAAVRKALSVADEVVILEPNGLNPVLKVIERVSEYHRLHEERSFAPALLEQWIRAGGGQMVICRFINLVPMFCPAPMARALKFVEPAMEALPLLRRIACGQLLIVARASRH